MNVRIEIDPAPFGGLSLGYSLSGSAEEGEDFTVDNSGRIGIDAGATGANIPISILDDSIAEGEEAIVLTLTGSLHYDRGRPRTHILTIVDNDEPNAPPTGADGSLSINEDSHRVFGAEDFGFADADAGDNLVAVRLVTLPGDGALSIDGVAATAGQTVSRRDIDAGKLRFTPEANAHGMPYSGFRFRVSDGEDEGEADNTIILNVISVNDPATGTPAISGTPGLGETLTADLASLEDIDGLTRTVYDYQWLRIGNGEETAIENPRGSAYTTTLADVGGMLKLRVSFRDDDGFAESLTSEASAAVAPGLPTAPIAVAAAAGDTEATLSWQIPEFDGGAAITGYEYHYAQGETVTEDAAWISAGASLGATVTGLENGSDYAFAVRAVNPAGPGAAASVGVFLPIPETMPGAPQGLDATGGEREIHLSWRAPADDGNTPIIDYEYRIAHGVDVPRGAPWQSAGADLRELITGLDYSERYSIELRAVNRIGPGPAVSTSAATAPRRFSNETVEGWLARFGRTAAGDTAEAIRQRLEEGPQRRQLIVGGRNVSDLFAENGAGFASGPQSPMRNPAIIPGATNSTSHPLGDLLHNSSFFYRFQDENPAASSNGTPISQGARTLWGNAASSRFDANAGGLKLDAEVDTGTAGFDIEWGRWLAGVAISHSSGDGRFADAEGDAGSASSSLTGVYPYAYYQFDSLTSFWGVAGRASGDMRLIPDADAPAVQTDISNTMAAFGGRSVFSASSREGSRFELAVRSDALLTSTSADGNAMLAAADASTRRLRLLLEASGSIATGGGLLSPTLEAGLRHDGGDAETGAGFELGGGLAWRTGPLTLQFNGRGLLRHSDDNYDEWGYSAGIQYQPDADGRGLLMNLAATRGAAFGGVGQLWELSDAGGLGAGPNAMQGRRTEFEVGYGLEGNWRQALWYPYFGVEDYAGAGHALKFGLKLNTGPQVHAGVEYGRRQNGFGAPFNAIQLRGEIRW